MKADYKSVKNYCVLNSVEVSAFKHEDLISTLMSFDSQQFVYSVYLVGVPAAISCRQNDDIKKVYANSSLNVIDGMPIVKKVRNLGKKHDRCSAPDFMDSIFTECELDGKTHYFYGGKNEEVLNTLKSKILEKHPNLKIVGSYCPPFRPLTEQENERVVNEINSLKPDFIWVGIGAPKQEKWIDQHMDYINSGVMIGVGAGFDFLSGNLKKAPKWVEKLSLEWLYRFFKEPKRLFKRYVIGGAKYLKFSFSDRIKGITKKNNAKYKESNKL